MQILAEKAKIKDGEWRKAMKRQKEQQSSGFVWQVLVALLKTLVKKYDGCEEGARNVRNIKGAS